MRLARALVATSLTALLLSGCASADPEEAAPIADPATTEEGEDGHGDVAGAAEVAEPPLGLVAVDADGAVASVDLLTGEDRTVGRVDAPSAVHSDGRYVFATTGGGLDVIDSGLWTWDHGDHFHYYRAEPALLGTVLGEGDANVTGGALSTAGGTGVFFAGSGDAVLLDNAALSDGEIAESFRVSTGASAGFVAPMDGGAVIGDADAGTVRFHDVDGEPVGEAVDCAGASGAIATRAGLVLGCDDGALVATAAGDAAEFERVRYPEGVVAEERAVAFDGRKGRPTVAAVAGDRGLWTLDARELAWELIETERPLATVVAVDDDATHVVALDVDGRVRVLRADTGEEIGVTEPLVEPQEVDRASVFVDGQRAYVNAASDGVVHEIAYADGARIARSIEMPVAPVLFAEVGR
ncbi:ABC transporter [Microbacterium marinilacus]|uniref:Lipoprotein n=1 Tax=Microbacterium marinilacus TaxID=415209 RepID=A0ABP7BKR5_9MICO|nr:ABC transporter [Microbacterium marinilacus]MBY0688338.1 ABC transporter [Microbacterium marinilacus]